MNRDDKAHLFRTACHISWYYTVMGAHLFCRPEKATNDQEKRRAEAGQREVSEHHVAKPDVANGLVMSVESAEEIESPAVSHNWWPPQEDAAPVAEEVCRRKMPEMTRCRTRNTLGVRPQRVGEVTKVVEIY